MNSSPVIQMPIAEDAELLAARLKDQLERNDRLVREIHHLELEVAGLKAYMTCTDCRAEVKPPRQCNDCYHTGGH